MPANQQGTPAPTAAVREARSLFNQECQAADTVYDADVQDRLDALIAATRADERARVRERVAGVQEYAPNVDWRGMITEVQGGYFDRLDVLAAIDALGAP